MAAVYAWLRRHPMLVDGTLALVLLIIGGAVAARHRFIFFGPLTLFLVFPVVIRRRVPVLAFGLAAMAGAVQVIARPSGPSPSDIAILVLLYTVAAYRPRRESAVALAVCLAGSLAAMLTWYGPAANPIRWLSTALVLFVGTSGIAWLLGDSMRYRRGYYAALEERAARLEAERDAQIQIAAAAERARIARELHDVIAHHVSVMVVQADGAGYALDTDSDRARTAISAIASTGRQALAEMRRLLGVLRTGDSFAGLAPVPGLGELRDLLDQARDAGMSVSFGQRGAPRDLPEGVQLAAYRVVQESLTNTRKHGGPAAAAAVALRFEPTCLVVQVTDNGLGGGTEPLLTDEAGPGPARPALPGDGLASAPGHGLGSAPGHGLVGMAERVAMYGGSVLAGPVPGGGWCVTARIPYAPHADRVAANGTATDRTATDRTATDRTATDRTATDRTAPNRTAPNRAPPDRRAGQVSGAA